MDALDAVWCQAIHADSKFNSMSGPERHQFRLGIKRLRYSIQFLGSAYGDQRSWLQNISRLQDALGASHDAMLTDRLMR